MSTRQRLWVLLAVFVLTAIVRLAVIPRTSLWPDELFSLALATGHSLEHPAAAAKPSLGDFVEPDHPVPAEEFRHYLQHDSPAASPARVVRAVLLSDTSPPLYYLLLYGWTRLFGTSDFALRLFSANCSLACLPLLVVVARRTGGERAVIPACVFFALSPLAIYYSTEGRMYSLLWLCVLATTWASLLLHQRGGTIAASSIWVAASVAGFLTHYFFVFPWLAMLALLAFIPGKVARSRLAACLLLTGLLLLPWYVRLPESLHNWRITEGWLNWRPGNFNRISAAVALVIQFFAGSGQQLWPNHRLSIIGALLLFGSIAALTVWRLRQQLFAWRRLLLGMTFTGACAGPLVFDLVQHTYTVAVPRYAIAGLPAACLLAAVGFACLHYRVRFIALLLVVFAWVPSIWSIYQIRSRSGSAIREIAHAATTNGSPSDLILVHSIPSGVLGVARYSDGPAALASWVGQLGNRRTPESLHDLAAGRTRILLIKVHEVGEPAPEEEWLRANAAVIQQRRFGAAMIIDFRPRNAQTF